MKNRIQEELVATNSTLLREEFIAMGKALGGGSGWVQLVFQPRDGTLVNQWAADHTHAYVDAFMENIDWATVYERYQHAVHGASELYSATHDEVAGALVLDVRRAGVFQNATTQLPGARWQDPAEVDSWASSIPADRNVIVYCVYGHEVGRATALRLRAAGLRARYLQGGIDGWLAAGRAVEPKGATPCDG